MIIAFLVLALLGFIFVLWTFCTFTGPLLLTLGLGAFVVRTVTNFFKRGKGDEGCAVPVRRRGGRGGGGGGLHGARAPAAAGEGSLRPASERWPRPRGGWGRRGVRGGAAASAGCGGFALSPVDNRIA